MDILGLVILIIGFTLVTIFFGKLNQTKFIIIGVLLIGIGLGFLILIIFSTHSMILINDQNIGTYLAIFVAICALFTSLWQGLEQRRFYIKSLRPVLGLSESVGRVGKIGIIVNNPGMGPALINEIEVYLDGQRIEKGESANEWMQALILLKYEEILNSELYRLESFTLSTNQVIKEGDKYFLLGLDVETLEDSKYFKFLESLYRLKIKVKYSDFYGKVFLTVFEPIKF
jgi:hypothetical protein